MSGSNELGGVRVPVTGRDLGINQAADEGPGRQALDIDGILNAVGTDATGIGAIGDVKGRKLAETALNNLGLTTAGVDSNAAFDALPGNLQGQLRDIAGTLGGQVRAFVQGGGEAERAQVGEGFQMRWGTFVKEASAGKHTSVEALIQWVLREAYLDGQEDLTFYAEKVKWGTDQKKRIREHISEMRSKLADMAGMEDTATISPPITPLEFNDTFTGSNAGGTPAAPTTVELTPEQQAEADAHQAMVDEHAALLSAWEAAPDLTTSFSANPNASVERIDGHNKKDKDDAFVKNVTNSAQAAVEDFSRWYNYELTDAQRAEFDAHILENGYPITAKVREHSGKDRTYSGTEGGTYGGPSPYEFVVTTMREAAEKAAWNAADDDGGKAKYGWMDFVFPVIPLSTSERPPQSERLQELSSALGLQQNSASFGGDAWESGDPINTKALLSSYIDSLEEKLSTVGEMNQLAQMDLQQQLQKQQQLLQLMSNVSKQAHDTGLAMIRKIG